MRMRNEQQFGRIAYLQLSKLASSQEHSGLAELPSHDLHRLQHLAGDVSRLVVLQGLRVQVAVGTPAARQQDVVAHGEGPEGLSGREARARNANRLQNTACPQLLQDVVGGQVAGLGLWVGFDTPAMPRNRGMENLCGFYQFTKPISCVALLVGLDASIMLWRAGIAEGLNRVWHLPNSRVYRLYNVNITACRQQT